MKQLITLLILCYSLSASAYYPTYVSKTDHLIALSNHSSGTWNSITLNNTAAGKPIHDALNKLIGTKYYIGGVDSVIEEGI